MNTDLEIPITNQHFMKNYFKSIYYIYLEEIL